MEIIFDGLKDFKEEKDLFDISTDISEVLRELGKQMQKLFPNLEFFHQIILLRGPDEEIEFGPDTIMDFYVRAPDLRGYRVKLFEIGYRNLRNYPVSFTEGDEEEVTIAENKERLIERINSLLKSREFRKKIIILSKQNYRNN